MIPTQRLDRPAYDLVGLRSLFPVTESHVYLNHAGIAPQADPVREAQIRVINKLARGSLAYDEELIATFFSVHQKLARLINAQPDEITLTQNTSSGLNLVAQGLHLPAGSNIVLADVEFPSNVYPWMNYVRQHPDVTLRRIPADNGGLTVAALEAHADAHTALVAVSTVQFLTGHRSDVCALGQWCRERDITFVVDGIQSLGHVPLDVRADNVHYLAAGGMKSLLGTPGQGFAFFRRDLLDAHDPPVVGATSVTDFMDWTNIHFDLRPEAARYELGTPNVAGLVGLNAAVDLLLSLGIAHIDAWTWSLADALIDDLQRLGYELLTPRDSHAHIVSWIPRDMAAEADALSSAGLVLTPGSGRIRASMHAYNTYDDVARIGDVLGAL